MFLQTLFASCVLCFATVANTPPSTPSLPTFAHHSVAVQGGRRFTAEIISPQIGSLDTRYPGTIIIATQGTRDRAFLIASRMAEIGITAMMYVQDDSEPHSYQVHDAYAAIDSMRQRYDVRSEEVGVIAFEQATHVVPALVRDTTLEFAIAASSADPMREMVTRYANAHAATLLVHGVRDRNDSAAIARSFGLGVTQRPGTNSADSAGTISGANGIVSPNVTVWPVSKDELKGIGDAHSQLGLRVVSWVRDQVHINAIFAQQAGIPHP
jgi:hypothetical protein